jgi:hypothetical protein
LPSRWLPGRYRSNAISFPDECPGTRDHHLAFSEAIPNLCLSSGEQANGDASRFNPIIANDLNDSATGPVQNSRQRNRRAAAPTYIDGRASKGTYTQLRIAADQEADLAELRCRIDGDREDPHLSRQFTGADDRDFRRLIGGDAGE